MTESARGILEYTHNGRDCRYSWTGQNFPVCEGLVLSGGVEGHRSYLEVTPGDSAGRIRMKRLEWTFPMNYSREDRIFMNGYQSWTDSWERGVKDTISRISLAGRLLSFRYHLNKYGDYRFVRTSPREGELHGFTYGYIRPGGGGSIFLFGSLSEAEGFTVFRTSVPASSLSAAWDCRGLVLDRPRRVLDLFVCRGEENEVFDSYFRHMDQPFPEAPRSVGWTSWYHYYQNISEPVILENLEAFRNSDFPIDLFQIDDGYQTRVGDWLEVDPVKFPRGLAPMAKEIHASGYRAGLWLAPFVCEKKSRIVREHPEWLLRDGRGRPVTAGSNWGGFFVLDFYRPQVKSYLREVFSTVLRKWHFDMVKLDFLYAVCMVPPPHKTRGEVMREAMVFLRECAGEKVILGCGVPLGSAFGLVEYCRIGCDVGPDWNSGFPGKYLHRERVSTRNALGNALGRRHLNGRAFMNDPDVFLLRDSRNRLTEMERETLLRVNAVTGTLVFTSDLVSDYDEKKRTLFREVFSSKELLEVIQEGEVFQLRYLEGRKEKVLLVNLSESVSRIRNLALLPRESVLMEGGKARKTAAALVR